MSVASARSAPVERTLPDRLLAAVPLLSIFLWLSIVYAVEAWAHQTPWLFGDELELTQLSRAIAATGHAARRGEPHSFDTLWTYVTAPAWRIHDVHTAYATVKYMAVLIMMLTAFPAYALARQLVGKTAALFVAAASCAIPAMAYSSMLVEEPLAYPYSTLCLFLILRTIVRPSPGWIAGMVAAAVVAPFVRGELVVIWAVIAFTMLFVAWRSARMRAWRTTWTTRDWVGFATLLLGAGVLISAVLGKGSSEWLISTDHYKRRIFDYGLNAAGALTIGLGVLPVVAGLASLWRGRGEVPARELTAFRSVLLAAAVSFGIYTAVKATYVSTVFGTYTYERNLIYLAPLLFTGTALWLDRRNFNPFAVVVASAFVLFVLLTTPYENTQDISYNAPGLAILQQANRYLNLDLTGARIILLALLALSAAVLCVRSLRAVAVVLAVGVLAWNFTGALAFASASNRASDRFVDNIRKPFTWVDDATGGRPTLYIGQQMSDPNGEWLLEFWNPHSLVGRVWSLDGTAPGPGPTLTPDPELPNGALSHDPHYPYVVEEPNMNVVGKLVTTHDHVAGGAVQKWRLVKVSPPLRLRDFVTGQYADGWTGATSAYTRFSTGEPGRVRIVVSRPWGGVDVPGHVTVRIGPIVIGDDNQPHVGRPAVVKRFTLHKNGVKTLLLPAPGLHFRVEVSVTPTFRPRELSPQTDSDNRDLGVKVAYTFVSRNAAHTKLKRKRSRIHASGVRSSP
jgi:hypothetical protein